jgi:hypothetical protein
MKKLLYLFLTISIQTFYAQSVWQYVGDPGFSDGIGTYVDLELDVSAMPYVIFNDASENNIQKTYRYNLNNEWQPMGGGANPPNTHNSLAIGVNGLPLISSFAEQEVLEAYYVDSIDPTNGDVSWQSNHPTNSGTQIFGCTLNTVIRYDGVRAYLAHGTNSNSIWVWRNDNYFSSNWSNSLVVGGGGSLDFSFDARLDQAVIAWSRSNNDGKLSITLDNLGVANDQVTVNDLSSGSVTDIVVKISSDLEYFVAFKDIFNGGKASVLKYDGIDSWEYVGSAGISASSASDIDLAIDTFGNPYIVYQDASVGGRLSVQKFNGIEWEYVGNPGFTSGPAIFCRIEVDNFFNPIIAFSDGEYSGKISVMKFGELANIDEQPFSQFAIAPVPADNILKIQGTQGTVSVKVFDLSGRLILQETTNTGLNVSGLTTGVYSILIEDGNHQETHKFIKN